MQAITPVYLNGEIMSEAKHTPGPWRYKAAQPGTMGRHKVLGHKHLDGGDYAPLCQFRAEADAHLTAAAPDMLEALIIIRQRAHD
jgi:hypothetical protein